MPYLIVPSSFAPKCPKYIEGESPRNVHSISFCKCNFNCEFCFFHYYIDTNNYIDYSPEQFKTLASDLIIRGNMFKFTGGEPTLNPNLEQDLSIIKKIGGKCFLDTNGSNPKIIRRLVDQELVDLFGISLKGLSSEEAMHRSRVKNRKTCWDNVLESLSIISNSSNCDLIVTYVCYEDFSMEMLLNFSIILEQYSNTFLKINNFQPNPDHPTPGLKPKNQNELERLISEFVVKRPKWKNRITIVDGPKAVSELSELILM